MSVSSISFYSFRECLGAVAAGTAAASAFFGEPFKVLVNYDLRPTLDRSSAKRDSLRERSLRFESSQLAVGIGNAFFHSQIFIREKAHFIPFGF